VLAGLAAGFRFHSMAVGPLQIDRSLRLSRFRGPGAWTRGWVRMVPRARDERTLRALVLVAGGPLANLLSGAVVLLLPFPIGPLSGLFLLASIAAGAIELLPLRFRTFAFDGWRIVRLLESRAWGDRWLAVMQLEGALLEGVLPEAWPQDGLARAVAVRDGSRDTLAAHALAYAAAFHRHRDDEAARCLEVALRNANVAEPALRDALISDAAVFQARRRGRVDLAEQWLDLMPEAPRIPWLRTRAEAGILEARGEIGAADEKLDELEKSFAALPDRVQRETSLRLLERWRSELRRQEG